MRAEEKVILSLSVLNPSPEIVHSVREMFKDNAIDFDQIFAYAAKNEVAPIVYENLRAFDVGNCLKTMQLISTGFLPMLRRMKLRRLFTKT